MPSNLTTQRAANLEIAINRANFVHKQMFDQPPGSAYINPLDLDILKSAMLDQGCCVRALYARGRETERTENGSFCLLLI